MMSFRGSFIGIAVAVFAFAGVASVANAVVAPVPAAVPNGDGVLENGETTGFGRQVFGDFIDHWNFTLEGAPGDPLASNSVLQVILENTNTLEANNIFGLTLELFSGVGDGVTPGVGGIGPVLGPVASVPSTPGTAPNSGATMIPTFGSSLAPGFYYFEITGRGIGNSENPLDVGQGFYNVQVTATPLPAAIWLMLSALLGLVSFARIRRVSGEAA